MIETSPQLADGRQPCAVSRIEAANALGVSLSTIDVTIAPMIPEHERFKRGREVYFDLSALMTAYRVYLGSSPRARKRLGGGCAPAI